MSYYFESEMQEVGMIQEIITFLLFAAALAYLVWFFIRQNRRDSSGCSSGCGGCSSIDFKKIEAKMKADATGRH